MPIPPTSLYDPGVEVNDIRLSADAEVLWVYRRLRAPVGNVDVLGAVESAVHQAGEGTADVVADVAGLFKLWVGKDREMGIPYIRNMPINTHIPRERLLQTLQTRLDKSSVQTEEHHTAQHLMDVVDHCTGSDLEEIHNDYVSQSNQEIKKQDNRFWTTAFVTAVAIPLGFLAAVPVGIGVALVGVGKAAYHMLKEDAMHSGALQTSQQLESFKNNGPLTQF